MCVVTTGGETDDRREDVIDGRSHFSSFTSVSPFILRLSATLRNAVNLS